MRLLRDKVVFITGGSRGIGREIALKFAADGAKIAIAAKTSDPHSSLPGTIHTVADEIRQAGGEALPLQVDIRNAEAIKSAIDATVQTFGGLDILVNNASAISPTGFLDTPPQRYDLLQSVNTRGTYLCSHFAVPHLRASKNPHVLTLSPPISQGAKWYGAFAAYAISKYGMTMSTLGVAEEFRPDGIAANSLWPRTMIATDAVRVHYEDEYRRSRHPAIMADAAYLIVTKDSRSFTGNTLIDEDFLRDEGFSDFSHYAIDPRVQLAADILID
ncbi:MULTISPECIES: NAD(P)-dependent oxidoreductase [unclassified Afipia]|uniref:SDR family oxidoreductase n=1 Tax=unclassified Afipia TaxID=2642050 RepID=UPI0004B899F5|nr:MULTISPECIES: NAD(P)-dependent oxidoreductase [unclassified Afipia]